MFIKQNAVLEEWMFYMAAHPGLDLCPLLTRGCSLFKRPSMVDLVPSSREKTAAYYINFNLPFLLDIYLMSGSNANIVA